MYRLGSLNQLQRDIKPGGIPMSLADDILGGTVICLTATIPKCLLTNFYHPPFLKAVLAMSR